LDPPSQADHTAVITLRVREHCLNRGLADDIIGDRRLSK
jgi:hypothetical protein